MSAYRVRRLIADGSRATINQLKSESFTVFAADFEEAEQRARERPDSPARFRVDRLPGFGAAGLMNGRSAGY